MTYEVIFGCSKCSFIGRSISEMDQHERIHSSPTQTKRKTPMQWSSTAPLECPNCSYVSKDVTELLYHSRVHLAKGRRLECPSCSGVAQNMGELLSHYSGAHVTTFRSVAPVGFLSGLLP